MLVIPEYKILNYVEKEFLVHRINISGHRNIFSLNMYEKFLQPRYAIREKMLMQTCSILFRPLPIQNIIFSFEVEIEPWKNRSEFYFNTKNLAIVKCAWKHRGIWIGILFIFRLSFWNYLSMEYFISVRLFHIAIPVVYIVDEIAIMVDGKEEKSHRLRLLHVMLLQIDVSG